MTITIYRRRYRWLRIFRFEYFLHALNYFFAKAIIYSFSVSSTALQRAAFVQSFPMSHILSRLILLWIISKYRDIYTITSNQKDSTTSALERVLKCATLPRLSFSTLPIYYRSIYQHRYLSLSIFWLSPLFEYQYPPSSTLVLGNNLSTSIDDVSSSLIFSRRAMRCSKYQGSKLFWLRSVILHTFSAFDHLHSSSFSSSLLLRI